MSFVSAFISNDLKNIRREYMLLYIMFMPFILIALLRFLLPMLAGWTIESFGFDLADYYPLILSFFVVMEVPFLFGVVYGLLLLDEKDEHVLTAMQVTPVPITYYLRYRIAVMTILGMIFVTIGLPLTGVLSPEINVLELLGIALVGGFNGMLLALIMIAAANNKVEGLAVMKGFGIMMLAPAAGFFVDTPLQILLGFFPAFWPAKALWTFSDGGSAWIYLIIGTVYVSLIAYLLLNKFKKKAGISI